MKNTILLLLLSLGVSAQTLEVRFQPDSSIYLYEIKGPGSARMLYSALIQNLAVVNNTDKPVRIESIEILGFSGGEMVLMKGLTKEQMLKLAKRMKTYQEMGMMDLLEFQFQSSKYLKGVRLTGSDTIPAGQALLIPYQALMFDIAPDKIEVKAVAKSNRKEITGRGQLVAINHVSKNTYSAPVQGTWFVGAGPSFIGHHRWATIQEFAFDLVQLGANNITHANTGTRLTDYYAYGKPVHAIGDGKVVKVVNDQLEDEATLRQPDESGADYEQRQGQIQQELMMKGMDHIIGNHVIIAHPNGEYSYYAHLQPGSIAVAEGQTVQKGVQIARVGNTGNSTEPHLHFHMANSPNLTYARSIPVCFDNVNIWPEDTGNIRHLHSGMIIKTTGKE